MSSMKAAVLYHPWPGCGSGGKRGAKLDSYQNVGPWSLPQSLPRKQVECTDVPCSALNHEAVGRPKERSCVLLPGARWEDWSCVHNGC